LTFFTASQVCFEVVGYLLEELRDASNFAAFKEDVADANIFIGSLIFIEELAEKVNTRNGPWQPVSKSLHCHNMYIAAIVASAAWMNSRQCCVHWRVLLWVVVGERGYSS
jgi:hypothetical protein